MKTINITEFAKRHFNKSFVGTKITSMTDEKFVDSLNFIKNIEKNEKTYGSFLHTDLVTYKRQGDFEFSRLITIGNFTNAKMATYPITLESAQYLRTDYSSRTPEELPVLSRWFEFPSWFNKPEAKYLTLVLYSKEQIDKENKNDEFDAEWGIVAILAHNGLDPEPMSPITMFRNSLGISEGGNGEPINKEKYLKSVEFWSKNANIK